MLTAILEELDEFPDGERVMLKLSIPAKPGLFDPLVDHPKVLRVVALSGGFSRAEACAELARNPGMIASFSRALAVGPSRRSRATRNSTARSARAIDEIYDASTAQGAGLTLDEDEFDPPSLSARRADRAVQALPGQPAGRWRSVSRTG